ANWVHGNHVITFGGQLQRVTIFAYDNFGVTPVYTLEINGANRPSRSDFPAPAGAAISSTDRLNAIALLASGAGVVGQVDQTFNVTSQQSGFVSGAGDNRNYRQNNWSTYLGDSWRMTRKLTFSYGVRWEYYSPVDEKNGLVLLPVIPASQTVAINLGVGSVAGYAIDPHIRVPYVEQWNLSIQRDLGWNTSLTIGYIGNHGVGLFRAIDVNQLDFTKNGFLADFKRARANGFLSLAANGVFDPLYSGPGSQPLTVFPLLFATGGIDSHDPNNSQFFQQRFVDDIQLGLMGALESSYHAEEWDTGNNPGPGFGNPVTLFANPFIMGGDLLKNSSFS